MDKDENSTVMARRREEAHRSLSLGTRFHSALGLEEGEPEASVVSSGGVVVSRGLDMV